MLNPRELEKLQHFDMPKQSDPKVEPDFSKECHYTIRIYTCTHRSYVTRPRITHVSPCPWKVPQSATVAALAGNSSKALSKHSKKRCQNMAIQAKPVHLEEQCSKCRPHSLGTQKQLRKFEVMTPDSEVECETERSTKSEECREEQQGSEQNDWGVISSELDRDLKNLSADGDTVKSVLDEAEESSEDDERTGDTKDQAADATPTQARHGNMRWVQVCPTAENGAPAPSVKLNKQGIFSRIFSPFNKAEMPPAKPVLKAKIKEDSSEDTDGDEEESGNGWVCVKGDPDWEVVVDEEKKEGEMCRYRDDWVEIDAPK